MPVGESFHSFIDSTHHIPIFYSQEMLVAEPLGSFVMQSTHLERVHSHSDPKIVEGDADFTYALARIPMESPEQAKEEFARCATVFERGESVGVTIYAYDQERHIPAMAIRIAPEAIGVDVLMRWPDTIKYEDVRASA